MKKSSSVVIGVLAFSASASLLVGCDRDKAVYRDVDACSADGNAFVDCDRALTAATAIWRAEPGFSTSGDCDLATGGDCVARSSSDWRPRMSGFLLAEEQPVEWERDPACAASAARDGDRRCDDTGSDHGSAGFYAGRTFVRAASSPDDDVATAGSRSADAAVDRGGLGDAAEGHGGGEGGHGGGE